MALSVQRPLMLDLRENERDFKNRKRFGWKDDDAKADWPHAGGAYTKIESSNKGRGDERHAGLERSQSGGLGCRLLPRTMSNARHLACPLFPLHKQLDRQRAVQNQRAFRIINRLIKVCNRPGAILASKQLAQLLCVQMIRSCRPTRLIAKLAMVLGG